MLLDLYPNVHVGSVNLQMSLIAYIFGPFWLFVMWSMLKIFSPTSEDHTTKHCVMLSSSLYCIRFTSIPGGKPIGTVSCLCQRSCRTVQADRALFPARGWSCSLCSASKLATTWPLSSTATRIPPGSSLTAWLTVMVSGTTFGFGLRYNIRVIFEIKLWCSQNNFCNFGWMISQDLVHTDGVIQCVKPSRDLLVLINN